ncbi:hypothetical protein ILUMI_14780, partial [Ignelater luminosus]
MAKTCHHLFKLLLIGDSDVGKTDIIFRYSENVFDKPFTSSIGEDTASDERFHTIPTGYYRGANGIMLVYDVTNKKSFENIKNWIRNIEKNASSDVEKMLLGNKCEFEERRQVSKERGEQLAADLGIKFIETSSKDSIRIEEAFLSLVTDIKAKMEKEL